MHVVPCPRRLPTSPTRSCSSVVVDARLLPSVQTQLPRAGNTFCFPVCCDSPLNSGVYSFFVDSSDQDLSGIDTGNCTGVLISQKDGNYVRPLLSLLTCLLNPPRTAEAESDPSRCHHLLPQCLVRLPNLYRRTHFELQHIRPNF